MASYNKINDFVYDLARGVHNFSSHTFKLALSNTAPASESSNPASTGNGILANVTQVAYTNLPGGVAPTVDNPDLSISGGTATFDFDNETITPTGGSLGPLRYVYLYNDTASGKPLIGYWDYGSSITLADGESLAANVPTNIFTLT